MLKFTTAPSIVTSIKNSIGAAPDLAITGRKGGGLTIFRTHYVPVDALGREALGWSPIEPLIHLRAFLFVPKISKKIYRRHTMPKKNWESPQTLQNAADALENLSALLQFIKDLTAQPTPPAEQYDFSNQGYYGLYLFIGFCQDVLEDSMSCIHKNS